MKTRLFTYGTLSIPEVMHAVTGAHVSGVPATAPGYRRALLLGEIYPGMTPDPDHSTSGLLFDAIDEAALAVLDQFEDDVYERRSIHVVDTGGARVRCEAYVVPHALSHILSTSPWNHEVFVRDLLEDYLRRCLAFRDFAIGARVLRPAAPVEAAALTSLALRSKAFWGYDEAFLAACANELRITPEAFGDSTITVASAAERLAGFYSLRALDAQELELDHLFVEPAAIGLGFGRALISHAIETGRSGGFDRITVQSDPNAEGFYKAVGAALAGKRSSASISGRELPLLVLPL